MAGINGKDHTENKNNVLYFSDFVSSEPQYYLDDIEDHYELYPKSTINYHDCMPTLSDIKEKGDDIEEELVTKKPLLSRISDVYLM